MKLPPTCRLNQSLGLILALSIVAPAISGAADGPVTLVVENRMVHLRNGPVREWSSFPAELPGEHLDAPFTRQKNDEEFTLRLRQKDVKQRWRVLLNDKPLGDLVRDENDQTIYLSIPAGGILDGKNVVRIEPAARGARSADDIEVGGIVLLNRPRQQALSENSLTIKVVDAETHQPIPARITLVGPDGSLQTTAAVSDDRLAVRPGVIYTADGLATFGMPGGTYKIYAGRGFEYSLAQAELTLAAGQSVERTLAIRREVPTPGYVACDTHVHTLTHSGHGDATITERMITLAGEGIELPIATDHNLHIDYEPHAERLGLRPYFTPVIGNEVTTSVGHFNVFPVEPGSRVANHKLSEWRTIFDEIFATPGVKVAILNHARDLHGGTRPFGPKLFNTAVGERIDGWPMRMNGMELVNSGANQTDALQLVRDWMAVLNRGYAVTPVGCSDSHDVSRHFVGQARTYIRCPDEAVAKLDVTAAVQNFLAGRVLVSYGLLAELTVAGKFAPGDLATRERSEVSVNLRVLGPHWVRASRVQLYANGQLVREEMIAAPPSQDLPLGVKWQATWRIPLPQHDVHLVAVAIGPGIEGPFWPTAKPYQPTSPDWEPHTLGISGAVWLDGDGDGRRTAAREYADRLFTAARGDAAKLVASLAPFDAAIAAQAAHQYRAAGKSLDADELRRALETAPAPIQAGFRAYRQAWRENERARAQE